MSRDPLPYPSRSRAHAIGPRHIYACRLSGCQASLTSALPPRSDPAGVPVSPGCQAAASVFALTPMTSGCPASVFPSGFAVSQGLAPCGPTSGHGCAPCGRCIYMAKCRLAPLISLRSKRRNRIRKERPLGSGIPPAAAPSFRGVTLRVVRFWLAGSSRPGRA